MDSHAADRHAPQRRKMSTGECIALWVGGLVLGLLAIVAVAGALFRPMMARRRDQACLRHVRQLDLALMMYTQDYGGLLPPANRWADNLGPYVRNSGVFACPDSDRDPLAGGNDYGFNSWLDMRPTDEITAPTQAPTLFESNAEFAPDGSANISDPLTSFALRHQGNTVGHLGYADGHVAAAKAAPNPRAGLPPLSAKWK